MTYRTLLLCFLCLATVTSPAPAENWPRFRGPTGQGHSAETNLPLTWSADKNVAWKTDVPGEAWSSPVVWDNRIFLTTALAGGTSCHVLALDRDSGKILWDKEVLTQTPTRKERRNSYATPTPVTDGRHVYAFFGSGHAAALDFDGNVVWKNTDSTFYSQHGLGSSPILHDDLLILPWDHSIKEGPELRIGWQIPWDKSYVLALDKNTGKERYRAKRGQTRIAHVTPNIVTVDNKPQLISPAGDAIEAFDPATGQLLWTAENFGEGTVPSPAIGNGVVYAASGFPTPLPDKKVVAAVRAYRIGGAGDVTKANLLWEQRKNPPSLASLLLVDDLLYSIAENGTLQALDAKTGDIVYTEKLKGTFSASPVHGDNKIYFLSQESTTHVVQPGRQFKLLASNEIPDRSQASLAVSNRHLFLRTAKSLYAIKPD
jgi:outer membrane protein assembly factor BamB